MRAADVIDLLSDRFDKRTVFVSSLGRVAELLHRAHPDRTVFLDSMGDVCSTSLGLALACEGAAQVVAVDTDGSFLMNMSVLPLVGAWYAQLDNWHYVIVDNELYESAGGLPSRGCKLDWTSLFGAVGVVAGEARTPADLASLLRDPRAVAIAKTREQPGDLEVTKSQDGIESAYAVERTIARLRGVPPRLPAVKL